MGCRPAHRASSGSAQFGAFLRERLLLPVSEESADECDVRSSLTQKILINNECPCHINIVDRNDHSHSMRPQRIHHSDDDGDCDSNSANDADVEDDSDDGGKQQRINSRYDRRMARQIQGRI